MRGGSAGRRGLVIALSAVASLAMGVMPAAPAAPQVTGVGAPVGPDRSAVGWPRQDFDLRNDSHNPFETQISTANVAELTVAWSARVDGQVGAGPIVIGRTLYVGTQSNLIAFDARDGRRLWTFPLGMNSSITGIAHWHDLVFVTDVLDHAISAREAA